MEDEAGGFETLPYKFSLNPSLKRREMTGGDMAAGFPLSRE
jgi:hypothetical protein